MEEAQRETVSEAHMRFKNLNVDVQYVLIGLLGILIVIPILILLTPIFILRMLGKFLAPAFGVDTDEK